MTKVSFITPMLDPHTAAELTLDEIWSMVDELIEAHGDYLPAYSLGSNAVGFI